MQRQHRLNGTHRLIGALSIRLVDDEDVRDLHDPGFERLHLVACARHERDDRDVGGADDLDFVLTNTDGLDEDDILSRGIEDQRGVARSSRQPAQVAARCHAADEDVAIPRVRLHADAVAEERAAGERTGRIHGHDADRPALRTNSSRKTIDERALPGPGRAGDTNQVGSPRAREDASDQIGAGRPLVFDERNRARDRLRVPGEHAVGEDRAGHSPRS
jgi:hypothetical protein